MFLENKDIISVWFYYYMDYQFSLGFQFFLTLASKNTDLMGTSDLCLESHV